MSPPHRLQGKVVRSGGGLRAGGLDTREAEAAVAVAVAEAATAGPAKAAAVAAARRVLQVSTGSCQPIGSRCIMLVAMCGV